MSQLIHILEDKDSLNQYYQGEFVSFNDIKRRLFLIARESNRRIPDSHYLLEKEDSFKNCKSIGDLYNIGLKAITNDYFEFRDNNIYIKSSKQPQWQELITYLPPLILQCIFLQDKVDINIMDRDSIIEVTKRILLPNTKNTAIPNARIPLLDYFVEHENGLNDLHMHLNGSMETDIVWQDYLNCPYPIYKNLLDNFKKPKVREQFEQESHLLTPLNYISLLKSARKLRQYFHNHFYPIKQSENEQIKALNKYKLLQTILDHDHDPDLELPGSYKHPFLSLITTNGNSSYLLTAEALMYLLILDKIKMTRNEILENLFHFYLLILGLTNRLLVQQTHQNGFDQFQKHTLNGLREFSEQSYYRRYLQMQGNDSKFVQFLEGRFSPKKTQKELICLIDRIDNDWRKMCKLLKFTQEERASLTYFKTPQLKLIAHFIKKPDDKPDDYIRHKHLRYSIWEIGKALALLLQRYPKYKRIVTGIDAAANEFDAGPEVFGPVFRLMRRYNIRHFTFHAGEDFYHIPGGLRAIYEAIVFCNLRPGDRIGHATAAGISPLLWEEVVGNQVSIRQGYFLDDLVFLYHFITKKNITELNQVLPVIKSKIQSLNICIYKEHCDVQTLIDAWLMRACCPMHTLEEKKYDIKIKPIFDEEEWTYPIENRFLENRRNLEQNPSWTAFMRYHDKKYRKDYEKVIIIESFKILTPNQMVILQKAFLNEMNAKEIVIETLPTSNVRIGFHKNFSTYHLHNWLKWREQGESIPPIVVGTDDTGIFATNIYNEYANIYSSLVNFHKMSHNKAMDIIKILFENSKIYKFD